MHTLTDAGSTRFSGHSKVLIDEYTLSQLILKASRDTAKSGDKPSAAR